MKSPLVTVVMTVFNGQPYLEAALQSIRSQTFCDYECVVVDDGSTDDTLAILQRWAEDDARLRILSRPNTGIVGALNDGLAAATGQFIARMDADDRCDPQRFELQVKRMVEEESLVALGSSAVAIDPEGRRLGVAPVPLAHDDIEECHLRGISCIYHPAAMIRRSAIERVGGYRHLCPAEDYDLWLRLGEVGQLANLPEPLFIWRRTVNGLVASQLKRQQRAVATALADAWARRGLPGSPTIPPAPFQSRLDLYRQWGWMALHACEPATGRRYAAKALLREPWSIDSWRLAVCALRGY